MPSPESVIPSSPPLLPVSFTTHGRCSPPVTGDDELHTSLEPLPRGQKRQYQDAGYEPSSEDPPVFSSDDWPPPELLNHYRRNSTNISGERRKRRFLPTQFGAPYSDFSEASHASGKQKRDSDNIDGEENYEDDDDDDDDDEDEGDISIQTIKPRREDSDLRSEQSLGWVGSSAKTEETEFTIPGSDDSFSEFWRKPDDGGKSKNRAERAANKIIQTAIEQGVEDIVLSDIGLTEVPAEIKALDSLISQHHLAESEALPADYYAPLTPSLSVYLGNNDLTNLAPQLFSLERLSLLSVRNNKLKEIPHWIRRLKNLRQLLISGNDISYLPWDIMRLEKLGTRGINIIAFPNPLLDLEELSPTENIRNDSNQEPLEEKREHLWANNKYHIPIRDTGGSLRSYKGSSEMTIFNILGKPITGIPGTSPNLLSSSLDLDGLFRFTLPIKRARSPPPSFSSESTSRVPSLIELSLRAISRDRGWAASRAPQRRDLFNEWDTPEHLVQLVEKAISDAAGGGQPGWMKRCGVCDGEYVIPAAEWLEWWGFHSYLRPGVASPPNDVGPDSTLNPNHPTLIFATGTTETPVDDQGNTTVIPLLRRACTLACAKDLLGEVYPDDKSKGI